MVHGFFVNRIRNSFKILLLSYTFSYGRGFVGYPKSRNRDIKLVNYHVSERDI